MQPSHARHKLLAFTTILAIITYIDRVAISSAAPEVRSELGLSAVQMGWVFSAFTWAYAAFEIPSGWMGDVMGPRKVLTRIVLWWSAFTAATGLAWNFASLVVARLLFGVGEAGAFPNTSRSFAKWFPLSERGSAHGWVFMGTRMGGAITPPIVVALMTAFGWRQTFFMFGALGVVWAWFWWRWFRDEPSQHPEVNAAELALIEDSTGLERAAEIQLERTPVKPNLLLVYGMYFTMGYTLYFNLTWLPTYLKDARGFTLQQAGWLSAVVLFTGGVATYFGGKLTDALVKRYGLKIGRSMGVVTLPIAGLLLIAAAQTTESARRCHSAGRDPRRCGSLRQLVLGDLPRHWRTQRRHRHRSHEHLGEHRRRVEPARGWLRGGLVEFVDGAVLHHRRRLPVRRGLHVFCRPPQARESRRS